MIKHKNHKITTRLMGKSCFILIATCTLVNIAYILQAQDNTVRWIDDFNYTTTDQLTSAGWALTRPAGISLAANAVVLNGTGGDCSINIFTSFSNDAMPLAKPHASDFGFPIVNVIGETGEIMHDAIPTCAIQDYCVCC
jgi:hypothetical protein